MSIVEKPAVYGYVDKSILVQVDGGEVAVGTVSIPVAFEVPDQPVSNIRDLTVRVHALTPEITVDQDGHDGCPADITFACYVRSGDDRDDVGTYTCCADCQPAATPYE